MKEYDPLPAILFPFMDVYFWFLFEVSSLTVLCSRPLVGELKDSLITEILPFLPFSPF